MRVHADTAAAGAGLVPRINNGKTVGEFFNIDKLQTRCTRLRKNLGIAAKQLSAGGGQAFMLTFTYRDSTEWQPAHVKEAIRHLRQWMKREHGCGLRYVWVLEGKERLSGARKGEKRPHYHCVVWVPHGVTAHDLKLDRRGWWPHGMTNAVKAVAAVRYVMKYVSKFDSPDSFPKGARCYGIGGLSDVGRRIRRWVNWPAFVQARASISDSWGPAKGGGWLDRSSGEIWPSEYGLSLVSKLAAVVVRLRDHGRPVANVVGPYSWAPGVVAP